jgi:hypothetical protein
LYAVNYTLEFRTFAVLTLNIVERITKEIIVEFISTNEIDLIPTHTKLCLPVINRIYKKMSAGIKFSGIKVEDTLICDGHHRYIASMFRISHLKEFQEAQLQLLLQLIGNQSVLRKKIGIL